MLILFLFYRDKMSLIPYHVAFLWILLVLLFVHKSVNLYVTVSFIQW